MSEKGAWMRDLFDDSNGDDNCLIFLEEKTKILSCWNT